MSSTRSVLLDLDGTLIDSQPGIVASAFATLRALGHHPGDALDMKRFIGPPLEAQRQFNHAVVDHIARNVPAHRETQDRIAALLDIIRSESEALTRFESLLVQYLQTITAYVDSASPSRIADPCVPCTASRTGNPG